MAFMNEAVVAEVIARLAHKSQVDMANEPYINHPERVVENLVKAGYNTPIMRAVGWLHDVIEDTDVTLEDLKAMGFSEQTVAAVDAITQRRDEDGGREYLDAYWERVKANEIARIVKVYGDIPDNADPVRQSQLDERLQVKLAAKYKRALEFLTDGHN